jgi:hypothetical protein
MPSRVYEGVISQFVSRTINRGPSKFMNVLLWNIVLFSALFFSVAYVTTLSPLSLIS